MGNCCFRCKKTPPTIFSVTGQEDLVDIEHERVRQAAIALNLGKGPVKLEGKFRIGFENESFTRFKRHPPEERGSMESVYKYVPAIPKNSTPLSARRNSR